MFKIRCWQGHGPSRGSRGKSVPCLFGLHLAADTPGSVVTAPQLPSSSSLSLLHPHIAASVSLISLCFLWGHLRWPFEPAHTDCPFQVAPLKIPKVFASANTLPHEGTSIDMRGWDLISLRSIVQLLHLVSASHSSPIQCPFLSLP